MSGGKLIVLDGPTRKFLGELPALRGKLGLSQRKLVALMNLPLGTYQMYEAEINYPSLEVLMRLAEFFKYDLSESVNYKYYHRQIPPARLKARLERYGLSLSELSKLTGYGRAEISCAINFRGRGCVACYEAVLEALRVERESEQFRLKYCVTREKGEALGVSGVEKEYLTRREVADYYSIHAKTIWHWVKGGRLPAAHKVGRKKLWRVSELLKYERAGKIRRNGNDEV